MPKADRLSPGAVKLVQEKHLAHLATIMPDGSPQNTPLWIEADEDGTHVLLNSTDSRVKTRNIEREPRVAISLYDPQNPQRYVTIRGTAELIHEGAVEHISKLAQKYTGNNYRGPVHERVIIKVTPLEVFENNV